MSRSALAIFHGEEPRPLRELAVCSRLTPKPPQAITSQHCPRARAGRTKLAETGIRAAGACLPASVKDAPTPVRHVWARASTLQATSTTTKHNAQANRE